jgi:preprotein translocase subunit YajC
MNSVLFSLHQVLLMAAPEGGTGAAGGGGLISFIPFIAIIAIFYFLIIRPQNKKQKETQKMLEALKKGDKIVTIGGIHGTIQSVKDGSVIVKVDENTKLEFNRSAVSIVADTGSKEKAGAAREIEADEDEDIDEEGGGEKS